MEGNGREVKETKHKMERNGRERKVKTDNKGKARTRKDTKGK